MVADGEYFSYQVTDFWGKPVLSKRNEYKGGASYKEIDLSALTPGYYELAIYSRFGPVKFDELARTSFSILEDHEFESAENSPFGMNMHIGITKAGWSYALVQECYAIGAMTIRDGHEWAHTESQTEAGKYSASYPAAYLINNYNMDYIESTGFNHPLYDDNSSPYTDDGREGFANFSKALYDLYPSQYGTLKNMEMFNEWFGKQFGDRPDKGTVEGNADSRPDYYVELVKKIYETINKEEYPDAVLFGEFGGKEWNEEIVKYGITDYMDAAAIHLYPHGEPEASDYVQRYKELKKLIGDDVKIWVTETGMNTAKNGYKNVTEEEQAMYLPRTHFGFLAEGVEKILWYDLLNDGTDLTGNIAHEDNFGLLHAKNSPFGIYAPKPAYVAYGVMTRMLDGKKFVSVDNAGDEYCYVFSDDKNKVSAVYSRTSGEVTVNTKSSVTVTDLMGTKKVYTPENGSVKLPIDGSVQYIEGDVTIIL